VPVVDEQLEGGPDAPATARGLIRERLAAHLTEEECFQLELLITELVTNAVVHAGMASGRTIRLVMEVTPDGLRVEVHDSGPGFEPGRPAPRDFEQGGGGFGLVLLDRFARRWGVAGEDGGARVWADLPRGSAA
jgi:anti-sigma regulatory factor (Ser/Thr protein kinase)